MMLYQMYEMQRLALQPMRAMVSGALSMMEDNPLYATPFGRVTTAALDSFEHTTRTFVRPAFGHITTQIDGEAVSVGEDIVLQLPLVRPAALQAGRAPPGRPHPADRGADVRPFRRPCCAAP